MVASKQGGVTLYSACCLLAVTSAAWAKEDIEFVQEHLPEVAMDNRYATLPMWSNTASLETPPAIQLQAAYTAVGAGELELRGPMLSIGKEWRLSEGWSIGAVAFYDSFELLADSEARDLETLFAPETPLLRPSPALFTGLDGRASDIGFGVRMTKRAEGGWLGVHEWTAGVLWQRVKLEDYRFDYVIQSGPDAGTAGTMDFDAQYDHIAPFGGLGLPRDHGDWSTNAHILLVYPSPRRGIEGHITGPGFDIHGDTADAGNGKHFGDPSVTLGYTLMYQPAHLSFDLGTLATQALVEKRIHKGIERNLLLSFSLAF